MLCLMVVSNFSARDTWWMGFSFSPGQVFELGTQFPSANTVIQEASFILLVYSMDGSITSIHRLSLALIRR